MQISVEKVSHVERRLTITVPANEVEAAYIKQINQYAKTANLKGFRPGKVPLSYIQQRFGAEARKEALGEVMQKAFHEAVATHHLKPINTPQVEPKVVLQDQPLEFIASFEILPEIEKIQFTAKDINKLIVNISTQDIQYVVEKLRKQSATWKMIDRPAEEKNRLVIDYYAIFEGKSDSEHTVRDFTLELGSKTMLPGFEEGLLGAKASEERTLNLIFPTEYAMVERAGKPVDFVVSIKQVYEAEVPELNDAFIKKLGIQSGKQEDLELQVKQTLEQERDRLVREKVKEQVFTQLLEQNSVEVPPSLVRQEAAHIHDEFYPKHQQHDHQHHSETEIASFQGMAKKRVALGLLIAEYAKQFALKIDRTRVEKRVEEIAAVYENPKEVMHWLSSKEQLAGIEGQIMEEQVLEKLLENVVMTEKEMTYADLRGIRV